MKKLLFLINVYLLFFSGAYSQDRVSISVFQDIKFAIQGDEARGYESRTLDLLFRFKMQGLQDKYGYFVVVPEYEYADLIGTYKRYSVNVGYTLNKLIVNRLEVTPMLNYGWIDRGVSTWSYGGSLEIMYSITDNIKIGVLNQFTNRSDLPNQKLGYSFFGGLEYNF